MKKALEINVYSLESAINADLVGADRIELCSSLFEGGCTPSQGMIQAIKDRTTIPIHAMLRPRGGDFCYSNFEKYTMLKELEALLKSNISGIVTGALKPSGKIDHEFLNELLSLSNKVEWTFHRAIDMTIHTEKVIMELQNMGFHRILTSGKLNTAMEGLKNIKNWVNLPGREIQIMAGSGVNPNNILELLKIGVDAVHMSGKLTRDSNMVFRNSKISMGGIKEVPEYGIFYSDLSILKSAASIIEKFNSN